MIFKFPISRFEVFDQSMEPGYKPGERVLTFNWGKISVLDVVVFKADSSLRATSYRVEKQSRHGLFPFTRNDREVFLIKRIDKIDGGFVLVSGDNKEKSLKLGAIKKDQVIGRVILKY